MRAPFSSTFNMKSVTTMTGVSEHTLRAWESRYEAVQPRRSTNGRRLYTESDVERLRLLARLVERGHAIGGIANLSDRDLAARVVASDRMQPKADEAAADQDAPTILVDEIMASIRSFDLVAVQRSLHEGRFRFGVRLFVLGVVAALMVEIGSLVATGDLTVAHEHSLSAVVKAHLMELLFSVSPATGAPRVAFATMEGDLHEIGLLISAVLCANRGFGIVYVGPNMPPHPLGDALRAIRTDLLVLGITDLPHGMAKWDPASYVAELGRRLPPKHEVWLGGLPRLDIALKGVKVRWRHIKSLAELDKALGERKA